MKNGIVGIVVRTVLALSAIAFSASTQVGAGSVRVPSRYVPGDDAVSAAFRDQSDVFLVEGGGTILALWGDDRANWYSSYTVSETSWDIYGMRFDAAGNQLETVPFPIVTGPGAQTRPRAAWNGTHWLVVFESVDWGGTGYFADSLQAVRVAPDGTVVDPEPIKLYNMTPITWDVASDGSGWVVVNQSTSVTSDIVASRISADGVLLDPGPRSLVPGTYYMRGPFELAYAGGVFLLAYEEAMTGSDPTNAIRFDANLDLLDAAPFPLAPARLKRMVSNGSQFYAVWHDRLPDYTYAVFGQRIDTDGQLLDGAGDDISGSDPVLDYYGTSVAWDGSQWKVTWGTTAGTRLARVTTAGQVLDPNGVPVPGTKSGISASPGDGSLQFGWWEYQPSNNGSEVLTSHVDAGNVAGPTLTLSVGAPSQLRPDVAAGADGYLMVYWSRTATTSRILAQPLDAAGNPLTAEPTELEATVSFYYPGPPAVAWNGSSYMVAWHNADGVVARRVQPDGTPIDASPILVLDPGFGTVDVEAVGGDFLVVGLRCGIHSCEIIYPIAARVRGSDGVVLDPTPIAMSGQFSSDPRLTVLGERWFLVWRSNITHDECGATTKGTFIDANGVKTPDFGIQGYSSCGGNGIFRIGVAASDNVALVVQSAELTSGVETDLLARRVDANGTVYPLINLTPWKDDQFQPRVAWDGSQFVIVYQDQRTNRIYPLYGHTHEQVDARSDLMGMRVTEGGVVIDPLGFVISNAATGETYPEVVASGGTTLIAASIMRNDSTHANYRIGYEFYGEGGNAWPVATASSNPTGGDVPLSVDFSSAGSSDPDGTLTAWAWNFGDGATSVEANPTHLYTAGGPYVATLTVTDDAGTTSLQELQVMALEPNVEPVAVMSSDVTSGPVPLDVVFDATGSYDPDGVIGNIEWQFSDGGTYWGSPAWYTFYTQGTHTATLIVHDDRGDTGSTSMEITVGGPDPPTAPSNLVAIGFTDEWINMTWDDNSNNEDGFKVERCSAPITFCNANPDAFVEIAQTGPNIDYYGDTGLPYSTTFHYRVRAFNVTAESAYSNVATATTKGAYPTAVIVASVLAGPAPLTVEFDGTNSYDPDSTIVQWSWSFGDGYSAMGPTATHTYNWPGWYWVNLHVWSDDDSQDNVTVLIKALDAAPTSYCGEAARTTEMLTLSKTGSDSVGLQWGASCVPSDTDYGVYAGPIGDFTAHVPVVCTTGGATSASFVPAEGDVYYLVVPNNQYLEGVYGSDSSGAEIPAGPTRCYPQATGMGCTGVQ
jgi:PKD repeat protein